MDITGIVINVILVIFAIVVWLIGTVLLLISSTWGKYDWKSLSVIITIATIIFSVFLLKFMRDGLLNSWVLAIVVLLAILNPLLAYVGAYDGQRNLMTNLAGITFLSVAISLILIT